MTNRQGAGEAGVGAAEMTTEMKKSDEKAVIVRVHLQDPVPGESVCFRNGHGNAGKPFDVQKTGHTLHTMQIELPLAETSPPKFRGPFIEKDSKGQFFYLRWGESAGDRKSEWKRAAKIYLGGLTASLVEEALGSGRPVQATFPGRAKDGGPCCATVPPLTDWTLAD